MIDLIVHATHEAGRKVGGIGAVLDGLLGAEAYNRAVRRTVLVGTMNRYDSLLIGRLLAPSNGLEMIYAPVFGVNHAEADLAGRLSGVEQAFGVALLYGRRRFGQAWHEVLLVDSIHARPDPVDAFKYFLWQHYGIDSTRYEYDLEYKDFVRSAPASYAALRSLVGPNDGSALRFVLAHEWMGLPLAFAAQLNEPWAWRTAFYAHEMPTARNLVEFDGGHDTRFYNALRLANGNGLTLDDLFGDQSSFFKHALVRQAVRCDRILAVGDLVIEELRFLGGPFRHVAIDPVYNGVPWQPLTLADKRASKAKLQAYAEALLGFRPDYVFTHVTRAVLSKALWRDLRVAEHLDWALAQRGKTAVLFMLSTWAPSGRRPEDVWRWEEEYGWPVRHRWDNGDLMDLEVPLYHAIAGFNWQSQAIKIVLVNQFGWDRERCGRRMPADMRFADIRLGTDVEFGQSIYEPFGIAQVEPLAAGALCTVSNVCGCVGFVQRTAAEADLREFPNLVVGDYTALPPGFQVHTPWDALHIGTYQRDQVEMANSAAVAQQIMARLPADDAAAERLLQTGQAVGRRMSWEVIARDYLLPSLHRAAVH